MKKCLGYDTFNYAVNLKFHYCSWQTRQILIIFARTIRWPSAHQSTTNTFQISKQFNQSFLRPFYNFFSIFKNNFFYNFWVIFFGTFEPYGGHIRPNVENMAKYGPALSSVDCFWFNFPPDFSIRTYYPKLYLVSLESKAVKLDQFK